jgi:hypothetical protein
MRNLIPFGAGLLLIGCTGGADHHGVPSARNTPHLDVAPSYRACASDTSFGPASAPPDIHTTYTYDGHGMLVHAQGVISSSPDPTVADYTWTADGQLTHKTYTWGTFHTETTAHYDPTDGLLDYTWDGHTNNPSEAFSTVASDFIAPDQPAHEAFTQLNMGTTTVSHDELAYDAEGRLVRDTPDVPNQETLYTYDDVAHTVTANFNAGAMVDVTTYDADGHKLSDTSSGSDPNYVPNADVLTWSGDRLLTETWSDSPPGAPEEITQVNTYYYDCP